MRVLASKLLVTIGAVIALAALAAAPALARPLGACNAHRSHAARVTPKVIVYAKQLRGYGYGGTDTVYYACARPAGKPIAIGTSSSGDGEYPGNYAVSNLRVAGTYAAAFVSSGYADAAACAKYDPTNPNCGASIHVSVKAVDARARRWRQTPIPGASALAVSAAGAIAWVQPGSSQGTSQLEAIVLHRGPPGRLAGAMQLVDTGAIGSSLRFSGLTLSWTSWVSRRADSFADRPLAGRSRRALSTTRQPRAGATVMFRSRGPPARVGGAAARRARGSRA